MADRTLTVNGQPFTFNRDRFAGVRTMTSGHVYPKISAASYNDGGVVFQKLPIGNADEKTFTLVASNSTKTTYVPFATQSDGIRLGKHRIAFDLTLNSGSLGTITGRYRDRDADPSNGSSAGDYSLTEGSNVIDFEIFDDEVFNDPEIIWIINTGSTFDISVTNFKLTHNYEEITVDRTAQVIDSDRKGESRPLLSKVVGGAAAAYSLRDLNDKAGNNKVVRVRRASDNNERDFLAKEVSNGTLQNWVNTQVVAPLDIKALTSTGRDGAYQIAKAAYSLRSLGTRQATITSSGDTDGDTSGKFVIQARRNVDGKIKSFTATEVTDGTLTSFVNESFTSSLPLDVSGSASAAYGLRNLSSTYSGDVVEVRRSSDDTLKSFKASEVSNGTLVNFVNEDINKLDLQTSSGGLAGNVTNKTATGFDLSVNNGSIGHQRILSPSNATDGIYNVTFDVSLTSGSLSGITATVISDDREIVVGSNSQNFTVTSANNSGAIFFRCTADAVADVSITNITLTQTSSDGHVKTWYDQSGNSRDAVQATSANQPKIVDAGVLVTDRDGKLALNGKGAKLDLPNDVPMLSADGTYSLFAVVDFDDQRNGNDDFNNILRFEAKTNGGASSQRKPMIYLQQYNGGLTASSPSYPDGSTSLTSGEALSVQLLTNIANPALSTGNNTAYADGSLVGSSNTNTDVNTETLTSGNTYIFEEQETTVTHFLSEVIYYPSDQSDKRRAIEESISGHYGITLGSFSRDGFVKTWYDQSVTNEAGDTATGNHAVQATAASQPKIVDAGSLNTSGGLEFDGSDDFFSLTSSFSFQNKAGCVFSLQDGQDALNDFTLGNSSSSRGIGFKNNQTRWFYTTGAIDIDNSSSTSGLTLFTALHDGTTNDPNVTAFVNSSLIVDGSPDANQGEANVFNWC